jgi:hypothetical protein
MCARIYITLDSINHKPEQVLQAVRGRKGVVIADRLDGNPDVLIALEARDRRKLWKLTTETLGHLENIVDEVNVLPVRRRASRPAGATAR